LKKVTISLLLASVAGLITSLILLLVTSISFFTLIDALSVFAVSTCIFFSLYSIQKTNSGLAFTTFYGGIVLILIVLYGILIPQKLNSLWPYELAGLLFLITVAILQLLRQKKDLFSSIARYSFWVTSVVFIFVLLTGQSNPIFYNIISTTLIIGTITLLISSSKNRETTEN
jgi:hypothetical protein